MGKQVRRSARNIAWIEEHCYIPEGRFVGQHFKLRPFQKKIIRSIYDTPTRRGIVSFGRKNAKTTLCAVLTLLHLCGPEARPNSQLNSAAQSRDQAAILFALAAKIVRMSPTLRDHVGIRDSIKELFCPGLGTLYKALSADAKTKYGLSPVFVVHDELGQVVGPRSELYEALETAAGAHENPLSIIISTQAPTDADLLSILIDDAKTGADPKVKLHLFTADETLDPYSEKAIKAANPAYGDFLNAEEVRDQAATAKRMPAREAAYRNLVLNQRVNTVNPLISRSVWIANGAEPDQASFEGEVFLGLDLSARNDLTAAVAIAKAPDGKWDVEAQFFAPMQGLSDRAARDRQPYDLWARDGFIALTPGSSIDYSYVAQWLVTYCDQHNVRSIKFDRWRIDVLKAELTKLGAELPLEPFGQGFKDMTPAVDALETALVNCQMRHGSNPVMTMCAANAIAIRDAAGNRKLDKSKSTGRIDGIVALTMAIGSASVSDGGGYIEGRLVAM